MSGRQPRTTLLAASLLLALLFGLLAPPQALAPLRPYWVALVLVYWLLEAPERVGLGMAFGLGLCADLVYGSLFGEQAMRLCVIAFLVLRFRARLRFFPLSQQALAVLALLLNDRMVALGIRTVAGEGWPPASFWLAPAVGALLWPWLFLLLDHLRLRLRGSPL